MTSSELILEEWLTTDEEELLRKGPQPYPPRIIKALHSGQIDENDTLILDVKVDAFPFPTFSWFLNDERLIESDNIHIKSDKYRSTLTVKRPKAGIYTVRAINEIGAATSSACIKHKGKVDI